MSSESTVIQDDIVNGLRGLGIAAGDVILVHSSLKRFGYVEGGVNTVIDALLEAVAPEGTVMVPTITATADHNADHPPVFDIHRTACWTGIIPETFRKRPDAVRSMHPTHSVAAIGPQAEFLTADHIDSETPCGPKSPYLKLTELSGKVVFLGAPITSFTLLHSVEELANVDYHLQPKPVLATLIDEKGRTLKRSYRIHLWGTHRNFPVIEPILLHNGAMYKGRIGQADIRVIDAKRAVELALDMIRKNPRALCRDNA